MGPARNPSTSRLDYSDPSGGLCGRRTLPDAHGRGHGDPPFRPDRVDAHGLPSAQRLDDGTGPPRCNVIHIFCALRGIDLVARVRSGIFFSASELDDLEREAGKPIRMLAGRAAGNAATDAVGDRQTTARCYRTSDGARFLRRLQSAETVDAVDRQTRSLRLHYLRDYLKWLGDGKVSKSGATLGTRTQVINFGERNRRRPRESLFRHQGAFPSLQILQAAGSCTRTAN